VAQSAKERLMRGYLVVSSVLFGAVALLHLLRLIYGWPAVIGTTSMPLWVSVIGLVIAGGLCIWGLALVRGVKDP
jgi:hypothetical protein